MIFGREEGVSREEAAALHHDAVLTIPPIEYVDTVLPPLATSLFDDVEQLKEDWRVTVESLTRQAQETPKQRQERINGAQEILDRVSESVRGNTQEENGNGPEAKESVKSKEGAADSPRFTALSRLMGRLTIFPNGREVH